MGERMNKAFEKILERFDEKCISPIYYPGYAIDLEKANEIVQEVAEEYNDRFNELRKEYKGGWIPCSERLPDEVNKCYLVTYRIVIFGEFEYVTTISYLSTLPNGEKSWEIEEEHRYSNLKVTAWMPLPECWKGENNG